MAAPRVVEQTPVITGGRRLKVSTIQMPCGSFDTAVIDESPDRRHCGMRLGTSRWIVQSANVADTSREAARSTHSEAVALAWEAPLVPREGS